MPGRTKRPPSEPPHADRCSSSSTQAGQQPRRVEAGRRRQRVEIVGLARRPSAPARGSPEVLAVRCTCRTTAPRPRRGPPGPSSPRMSAARLDDRRAVADQRMAAPVAAAQHVAGDGHHVAPLLERAGGGDQRARPLCRLDDDDGAGQAADQPIAHREVERQRRRARRVFAEHHAAPPRSRRRQRTRAPPDRCDRGPEPSTATVRPVLQRAAMRRRIDAARQAADDGDAGAARPGRQRDGRSRAPPPTRRASRRSRRPGRRGTSRSPRYQSSRRAVGDGQQRRAGTAGIVPGQHVDAAGGRGAAHASRARDSRAARPVRAGAGSSASRRAVSPTRDRSGQQARGRRRGRASSGPPGRRLAGARRAGHAPDPCPIIGSGGFATQRAGRRVAKETGHVRRTAIVKSRQFSRRTPWHMPCSSGSKLLISKRLRLVRARDYSEAPYSRMRITLLLVALLLLTLRRRRWRPMRGATPRSRWSSASPSRSAGCGARRSTAGSAPTQIDPTYAAAHNNLAIALRARGRSRQGPRRLRKGARSSSRTTRYIKQNYELFKEINDRTTRTRRSVASRAVAAGRGLHELLRDPDRDADPAEAGCHRRSSGCWSPASSPAAPRTSTAISRRRGCCAASCAPSRNCASSTPTSCRCVEVAAEQRGDGSADGRAAGAARRSSRKRRISSRTSTLFANVDYWKQIGEEYQQPLIVTGTVMFTPHQRNQDRPARARRSTTRSAAAASCRSAPTRSARASSCGRSSSSSTAAPARRCTRESFREEILYNANQTTPALSSYFELMDRLIPSFLSTLSSQKIKGTRVLLQ